MSGPKRDRTIECEIAIVGAGPAGIAAACAARESMRDVLLIDDTPWLGGQIWRGEQTHPVAPQAQQWIQRLIQSGTAVCDRTSVIAAPEPNVLLAEQEAQNSLDIRYQKLILATGARELFLPFPGWTLPGVMGAGGLQAMVKAGWPIEEKHVVVAGSGPLLPAVADGLKKHGAAVVSVNEQAPLWQAATFGAELLRHLDKLRQAIQLKGRLRHVPYRCGVWPVRAEGDSRLQQVILTDGDRRWTERCDFLACSFGLVPNIELPLAVGCSFNQEGFVRVDEHQRTTRENVHCAGEPTGIGGVDCALVEGQIAGYAAAGETEKANAFLNERRGWHRFRESLAEAFALRDELKSLATDETLLCRCEDVMIGQVRRYNGWREAKLQTRCGMGPCQGRVCGSAAEVLFGWGMQSVRPPILPARVGSLR